MKKYQLFILILLFCFSVTLAFADNWKEVTDSEELALYKKSLSLSEIMEAGKDDVYGKTLKLRIFRSEDATDSVNLENIPSSVEKSLAIDSKNFERYDDYNITNSIAAGRGLFGSTLRAFVSADKIDAFQKAFFDKFMDLQFDSAGHVEIFFNQDFSTPLQFLFILDEKYKEAKELLGYVDQGRKDHSGSVIIYLSLDAPVWQNSSAIDIEQDMIPTLKILKSCPSLKDRMVAETYDGKFFITYKKDLYPSEASGIKKTLLENLHIDLDKYKRLSNISEVKEAVQKIVAYLMANLKKGECPSIPKKPDKKLMDDFLGYFKLGSPFISSLVEKSGNIKPELVFGVYYNEEENKFILLANSFSSYNEPTLLEFGSK